MAHFHFFKKFLFPLKWAFDQCFRSFVQVALIHPHQDENPASILVVTTDGLGDAVVRIRFLRNLSRSFTDQRIVFVVRHELLSLYTLFVQRDQLMSLNHERYRWNYHYRWQFLKKLLSESYALAIYPVYSRSSVGDEIVYLSRAHRRITYRGDDLCMSDVLRERNNTAYTSMIDCPAWLPEEQKYALMERELGIGNSGKPLYPTLNPDPQSSIAVRLSFEAAGIKNPFDLFFPAAGSSLKEWGVENSRAFCREYVQRYQTQLLLCAPPNRQDYLYSICDGLWDGVGCHCHHELKELPALIHQARAVVSMDSGPAHLALALQQPTVILVGGGQFRRHFPLKHRNAFVVCHRTECYYCNWKCLYPEPHCVTGIAVGEVLAAFQTSIADRV